MEKINTPLMTAANCKELRISVLKEQYKDLEFQFPKPINRLQQISAKIEELELMLDVEKAIMMQERGVIEKSYDAGQNSLAETDPNSPDPKDYYNQTFKNQSDEDKN